jgi:hypothetical protein
VWEGEKNNDKMYLKTKTGVNMARLGAFWMEHKVLIPNFPRSG